MNIVSRTQNQRSIDFFKRLHLWLDKLWHTQRMDRRIEVGFVRALVAYSNNGDIMGIFLQSFLATTGIMQARTENRCRIEINQQHFFCKLSRASNQYSLFIEDH